MQKHIVNGFKKKFRMDDFQESDLDDCYSVKVVFTTVFNRPSEFLKSLKFLKRWLKTSVIQNYTEVF